MKRIFVFLIVAVGWFALGARADSFVQASTDRRGGDFFRFELRSPSPAMCQQTCADHAQCLAYTYVQPGVQGPKAVCYLKSPAPAPTPSSCCISGAKAAPGVLAGAIFLDGNVVPPAPQFPTPDGAQRVGYASMPRTGVLPVLVVIASYPLSYRDANGVAQTRGAFGPRQDANYYRRILFGNQGDPDPVSASPSAGADPTLHSVASYYFAQSNSSALLVEAAILGVTPAAETESAWAVVQRAARSANFDFSRFDRNDDGVVDHNELLVVFIDNGSSSSGNNNGVCETTESHRRRPDGTPTADFVRICGGQNFAKVGHNSAAVNFAHEIGHSFGAADIYGTPDRGGFPCWSQGLTLMSCTGWDATDRQRLRTFALDPWHRMAFAWARPRFASIAARSDTVLRPLLSGPDQPLILYDPARGLNEFYMLERRSSALTSVDADSLGGTVDGVVFWHVVTDGTTGRLYFRPWEIVSGPSGHIDARVDPRDQSFDDNGDGRPDRVRPGPTGVRFTMPAGGDRAGSFAQLYATTQPLALYNRVAGIVPTIARAGASIAPLWFDNSPVRATVQIQSTPGDAGALTVHIEPRR